MKFIGIDLHSNCFTACIMDDAGARRMLTFDIADMAEFYKHLDHETYVLVEASTNTFRFVERLRPHVREVYVANPYKLKLISITSKKTDRVDARKLATFLKMQVTSGENLIEPVYIPDDRIQELRSLFSTYRMLRKHITATKNRIHALLKQDLKPFTKQYIFGKRSRSIIRNMDMQPQMQFQINLLFDQLENTEESLSTLQDQILTAAARYRKEIDLLTSMKGISVFTAIAIISDIATVKRFPSSKHFASYLRSAPKVDSSNTSTRIGSTSKEGRRLSVTLLTQSLNHFRDANPKLRNWYDSKLGHKSRGKIRMALCRKVFTEIYQMLKNDEYHHWRDIENHRLKMERFDAFISARLAKVA